MKRFLAAMVMLFVCVLAIWVAFRLASETWAMIAGIVFGLVATLPMCAVVVIMLLRGQNHDRPPQQPVYYAPPQPLVLDAEPAPYAALRPYAEQAPAPYARRPLPLGARYPAPRPAPPRAFLDRAQASAAYGQAPAPEWMDPPAWEAPAAYGPAAWETAGEPEVWDAGPEAPRQARILG